MAEREDRSRQIDRVEELGHENAKIIASLQLRIEAIEAVEKERQGIVRLIRNSIIVAVIAAFFSAAAIISGVKGWIRSFAE